MSGLVHLYCGDGKGKTTAAMGLAVRCAGWQERVLVVQLMKQDNSGERRILEQLPQVTLWETYPDAKFSFRMTPAERQRRLTGILDNSAELPRQCRAGRIAC